MRIAAIDIGTNSIHVVIAQAHGQKGFEVLDREREVVQIGRGSFLGNRLRSDAIARTVDSLARFVDLARRQGAERILCTATAAAREAKNGGEFVRQAKQVAGITPRVIPAREEGRLIWLAVKNALELSAEEPSLVLDIGGGSLQMVVGTADKLLRVVSVPLGALRLSEILPLGDPPAPEALARLRRSVKKTAREALAMVKELAPRRIYGSSGAIHALAHVSQHLEGRDPIVQINGHKLTARALERTTRAIEAMPLVQRIALPGIDEARAEILVQGAVVLDHVLREVGGDAILVSDFGVREGLIADYIARHAKEIERLDPVEDLKLRSVLRLLDKFRGDEVHARHVTGLALSLFDAFADEHRLKGRARRLLEYAGLLHDVGSTIGHENHTAHSSYIIKNGNLRGLSAEDVAIVALVAGYHGKKRPRKSDAAFAALRPKAQRAVRWLAAILRIAEALDRSQYQLVLGLRVTRAAESVTIRVTAREDARLEAWAARSRTRLLARLLGRKVRVLLEAAPRTVRIPREAAAAPAAPPDAPRPAARAAEPAPAPAPRARARASAPRAARARRSAPRGRGRSPAPAGAGAASRSVKARPKAAGRKGRPPTGSRRRSGPS
jgi:exopolyphosphatase/guanosine-5'-triphosphate,3'-diphosphate pyrophosphatase